MRRRDWTDRSPLSYRVRPRRLVEVKAVVLHQTSFEWDEKNSMWAKVKAHAVVHRSGLITDLHGLLVRMLYGCGHGNVWAYNVEFEGNLRMGWNDAGAEVFWMPEKFGRSVLTEQQIETGRALVAWLKSQVPGIMVGTHRLVEVLKSGCCGPDVWREVGQYAVDELDMPELPVSGGRPIPMSWRTSAPAPAAAGAAPTDRSYLGPLTP